VFSGLATAPAAARASNQPRRMTNWPECEFIIIERDEETAKTAPSVEKTGWETVIFDVVDEEDG
jgi:hypothetical protein